MNWICIMFIPMGMVFWPPTPPDLDFPSCILQAEAGVKDGIQQEKPIAYFKGHGYNPSWKLTIFSDSISFVSDVEAYASFSCGHQEPEKDSNSNIKSYNINTDEGHVTITIGHESCAIDESNESFAYSLNVEITQLGDTVREFIGCGRYITDVHLQGRWVLEQVGDLPVDEGVFNNNLPSLEIVPGSNSFSGFSGCNKIKGRLFSERNLLRFTDIVSTKMNCDNLDKEEQFLEALRFSTQFQVDGDQLILSNPINTTLILKRE